MVQREFNRLGKMESKNTTTLTKDDLQEFEKEIAGIFATGAIRAPVHLRAGREEHLIEIFDQVLLHKSRPLNQYRNLRLSQN